MRFFPARNTGRFQFGNQIPDMRRMLILFASQGFGKVSFESEDGGRSLCADRLGSWRSHTRFRRPDPDAPTQDRSVSIDAAIASQAPIATDFLQRYAAAGAILRRRIVDTGQLRAIQGRIDDFADTELDAAFPDDKPARPGANFTEGKIVAPQTPGLRRSLSVDLASDENSGIAFAALRADHKINYIGSHGKSIAIQL